MKSFAVFASLALATLQMPLAVQSWASTATPAKAFLNSLGVNTHVDQGYSADGYVPPLQYLGVRNVRDGQRNSQGYITLRQRAGVKVCLMVDPANVVSIAKPLAQAGALLAIEGPNEPNNFPLTYNGNQGGGQGTWLPVAQFQRDLYATVKGNATLKNYPVFGPSECGGEIDNVGLQFLTIPAGSNVMMPDETKFSDAANIHNYVQGTWGGTCDNQAWGAASPTQRQGFDGLSYNQGWTWAENYAGYSDAQLQTLPRVTTETGFWSQDDTTARFQGCILVNTYLAQFKQGWAYTFIYELVDGEGGGGYWGLFYSDYTPKPSANFIHNLTTILADTKNPAIAGTLAYSIPGQPATVHDLLLQKSNGALELVVWGEQISGSNKVTVNLGATYNTVNVYDVTAGVDPIAVYQGASAVTVPVSDHALILEIH
jgi:hypothetical protein